MLYGLAFHSYFTISVSIIYMDPDYNSPLIYWWGYCNLSIKQNMELCSLLGAPPQVNLVWNIEKNQFFLTCFRLKKGLAWNCSFCYQRHWVTGFSFKPFILLNNPSDLRWTLLVVEYLVWEEALMGLLYMDVVSQTRGSPQTWMTVGRPPPLITIKWTYGPTLCLSIDTHIYALKDSYVCVCEVFCPMDRSIETASMNSAIFPKCWEIYWTEFM